MEFDVSICKEREKLQESRGAVSKYRVGTKRKIRVLLRILGTMNNSVSFFICALLCCLLVGLANGNVVLLGRNVSIAFDDVDANFTPTIKVSGESGILYLAEPLDACTPLANAVVEGSKYHFALIIRGRCSFEDKVRSAQNAGYRAAIIYDNEDEGALVTNFGDGPVAGIPEGIKIHAVFISKASGRVLKEYVGRTDLELWIIPNLDNSPWSIMAVSFILLVAMSAVAGTCYFVQRHHVRRGTSGAPQVQESHGMSRRLVKAMPSLIFTRALEDNCTSRACAICLEDYNRGEKLRVLPCHHKFHAACVDSWLTSWRTFCPVCKRDARTSTGDPPASESTPLLSSGASSPSSTANFLSVHSSFATSPPLPILMTPSWSRPSSRTHSLSSTSHLVNSYKSYNNSPSICINRSSGDLRNASSLRSQVPHLTSPHSLNIPLSSPLNPRYMPPYIHSSSNASPSYLLGSSGQHSCYLRHCESGASLSALASAQSLPLC
ncbi:receptor homology region, transmembrane domain- and RING domain-containing protein 2-like [Iris pallida]|uniref:Receptor homology region, transmembrane domain-and RING domain-containing protein 2-like n=1 Tax=Iris pallida TaxID=29817 RepID=A0AAX6FLB3_IRIPA|nr:receptor homology region, transmembrane domain- and RING domain-containing protein 2-like [Iris pallida]